MGGRVADGDSLAFDPAGVSPTREIAAIMRRFCSGWTFAEVRGAGHMAPLTRPDLINPLVGSFLQSVAENRELIGGEGNAPRQMAANF
jgi:pimeloyl-ACP methyl ester carboxylesterase